MEKNAQKCIKTGFFMSNTTQLGPNHSFQVTKFTYLLEIANLRHPLQKFQLEHETF